MGGGELDESRKLLAVIDRLYDAVTDLDKWAFFLESAAAMFGARGAQVGHTDLVNSRLSFSMVHGYDWGPAYMQNYERLMAEDPRLPHFSANPFKPIHCRMSLSDEQLHASRVYQEVLSVGNVEYSLGVNLVEDNRTLTYFLVLRDRTQPAFSERDCDLMALLIPHLNRALKLQRDLGLLEFGRNVACDTLDSMALGLIVIDADARMSFFNQAAREIADAEDGIRFVGQRLLMDGDGDGNGIRTRAQRLIRSALSGCPLPSEAFEIARPSGREAYTALVSTLHGSQLRPGSSMLNDAHAVVYVRDPDRPEESRAEILQRLYGLSPSQARLAELLANGHSLTSAAALLDITTYSARQYLKLILHKTGTHRQAELVRKVLLLPPAPKWRDMAAASSEPSPQHSRVVPSIRA